MFTIDQLVNFIHRPNGLGVLQYKSVLTVSFPKRKLIFSVLELVLHIVLILETF